MRHRLLSILAFSIALLALAACSDHKPHYDVDRQAFPVKGIDVSSHNGAIDFEQARADSVDFVYVKATEGIEYVDPMYAANAQAAHQAGLRVGAYHFFRFGTPGHLQAYHFLQTIGQSDLDLPLAIDVEEWQNDPDVPYDEAREQLRVMVDALTSNGLRVIIYTNKDGYARYVDGHFPDVDIWLCGLSATPPSTPWTLWQHSHAARVAGISTPVDLNTFAGTPTDFAAWLLGS